MNEEKICLIVYEKLKSQIDKIRSPDFVEKLKKYF